MKNLNIYITEKLKLNKDINVSSHDAFTIFKIITNLNDDEANNTVKDWIEQHEIETFNEIYGVDKDVDAIGISDEGKQYMHVMSKNTFIEKSHWFDDNEDSLENVYINNEKYIKIWGWKNGLTYGNPKLMSNSFIFYYNRNKN